MTSNPSPSQVVLVTGSSTGIGRATVQHFSAKGWTVVATMRRPEAETELMKCPGVTLEALDVTNHDSIRRAIANTIASHGRIDAVVNNA